MSEIKVTNSNSFKEDNMPVKVKYSVIESEGPPSVLWNGYCILYAATVKASIGQ